MYGTKHFFDDDELETKRSECISQVTKGLKEIHGDTSLQRLDFILRDLNTDNDVMTAEEKPTLKGVKSHVLMEELETISCQWQGAKLTIYGSRLVSFDLILTYNNDEEAETDEDEDGRKRSEVIFRSGRFIIA
ncbi:hypothetical protein BDF21DRAFT_461760 [Thamnidium elegans]|nr:hypothetical protein BDF21DRAFT_461760 [Thamnidium elegans]